MKFLIPKEACVFFSDRYVLFQLEAIARLQAISFKVGIIM